MASPISSELDRLVSDESGLSVAAIVAGEDLRVGDDVAILNETLEFPSCLWTCDAAVLPREELVRIQYASREPGVPLRVVALCLPFVFLETLYDQHKTVDLRLVQLVRLSPAYVRAVRKAHKRK